MGVEELATLIAAGQGRTGLGYSNCDEEFAGPCHSRWLRVEMESRRSAIRRLQSRLDLTGQLTWECRGNNVQVQMQMQMQVQMPIDTRLGTLIIICVLAGCCDSRRPSRFGV